MIYQYVGCTYKNSRIQERYRRLEYVDDFRSRGICLLLVCVIMVRTIVAHSKTDAIMISLITHLLKEHLILLYFKDLDREGTSQNNLIETIVNGRICI